jgi:hypothetical protein
VSATLDDGSAADAHHHRLEVGTTTELNAFPRTPGIARTGARCRPQPPEHQAPFAIITDPGKASHRPPNESRGSSQPSDIGGRYSALTYVGHPGFLIGIDLDRCSRRGSHAGRCREPDDEPGFARSPSARSLA